MATDHADACSSKWSGADKPLVVTRHQSRTAMPDRQSPHRSMRIGRICMVVLIKIWHRLKLKRAPLIEPVILTPAAYVVHVVHYRGRP